MKWVAEASGHINWPGVLGTMVEETPLGVMVVPPGLPGLDGVVGVLGATTPGIRISWPAKIGLLVSRPLNLVISATLILYFFEMELSVSFLATAMYTPST